jgi:hypothetical protein
MELAIIKGTAVDNDLKVATSGFTEAFFSKLFRIGTKSLLVSP